MKTLEFTFCLPNSRPLKNLFIHFIVTISLDKLTFKKSYTITKKNKKIHFFLVVADVLKTLYTLLFVNFIACYINKFLLETFLDPLHP